MQVILDSSFARPGSAPIWGGMKGEFRDWTKCKVVRKRFANYTSTLAEHQTGLPSLLRGSQ